MEKFFKEKALYLEKISFISFSEVVGPKLEMSRHEVAAEGVDAQGIVVPELAKLIRGAPSSG